PFYYYHNGRNFEFASQISTIRLHHNNLTISKNAIESYLTWGAIPDPSSIFNEIKKLLPGHSFIFDLDSGQLDIKKYWDIDYQGIKQFAGSYVDAKLELKSILSDAVKIR